VARVGEWSVDWKGLCSILLKPQPLPVRGPVLAGSGLSAFERSTWRSGCRHRPKHLRESIQSRQKARRQLRQCLGTVTPLVVHKGLEVP
jgi:uncharacterized membrane protein